MKHATGPKMTVRRGRALGRCLFGLLAVTTTATCGVSEMPRPMPEIPAAPGMVTPPTQDPGPPGNQPGPGSGGAAAGGQGGTTSGSGGAGPGNPEPGPGPRPDAAASDAPGNAGPPPVNTPPASGITVSINGTLVPKEKVIVFLHIGHSNMAGRAMAPATLKPYFYDTDPHLWRYQKGGSFTPAAEPLSGDGGTPGYPQGAGPGMALLRTALAAAPDAYIVSIGKGASLDFSASCFSFRKGGIFYDTVMGPALELKGKVTFAGLFAMFGYDGRSNPKAQSPGYINCLKGLAEDYRTDLGEPNLPYVQSDYERGATGVWSPACCGAPQVIAQMAQIPDMIPHSLLIPTDGIPMQDNHHFNMTGHQMWAARAFMAMQMNQLAPWATAK